MLVGVAMLSALLADRGYSHKLSMEVDRALRESRAQSVELEKKWAAEAQHRREWAAKEKERDLQRQFSEKFLKRVDEVLNGAEPDEAFWEMCREAIRRGAAATPK